MKRTGRFLLLTVAATIALVAGPLTPALANLDCRDTSLWCPEGASQRYWWSSSLTTGWVNAVQSDISHDLTPTDLITQIVTAHDNSDVAMFLVNNDIGGYGAATCQDPAGSICRHWHLTFTSFDYPGDGESTPYGTAHRNRVTCMELGHASGLEHQSTNNLSDPSCMYEVHGSHNQHLNTHDINHINQIV